MSYNTTIKNNSKTKHLFNINVSFETLIRNLFENSTTHNNLILHAYYTIKIHFIKQSFIHCFKII